MPAAALTLRFFQRELRNRFAGSFSGGLWALLQPLIQLAVYSVRVRATSSRRAFPVPMRRATCRSWCTALWPWTAFAEAVAAFDHRDPGQRRADRQGRAAARGAGAVQRRHELRDPPASASSRSWSMLALCRRRHPSGRTGAGDPALRAVVRAGARRGVVVRGRAGVRARSGAGARPDPAAADVRRADVLRPRARCPMACRAGSISIRSRSTPNAFRVAAARARRRRIWRHVVDRAGRRAIVPCCSATGVFRRLDPHFEDFL